jgi:hypothetical protein
MLSSPQVGKGNSGPLNLTCIMTHDRAELCISGHLELSCTATTSLSTHALTPQEIHLLFHSWITNVSPQRNGGGEHFDALGDLIGNL